jgi:DNA-binding transcriptional ArsR family regulator
MIVYYNEDAAYLSWLSRHRQGFVLDALRKPTKKRPTAHRASCPAIKKSHSRTTHWTTGRHLKACSWELEDLIAWAKDEFAAEPILCEQCAPLRTATQTEAAPGESTCRLTKLCRATLDEVIESAVIHLDNGDRDYDVVMADLAKRLGKSPLQISAALSRLAEKGLLEIEGRVSSPANCRIFPTTAALRSLSTFATLSNAEIAEELERLHPETLFMQS